MSDEKLYDLYVNQKLSLRRIAERYGGTRSTYSKRLKEMGVEITGNNPGQKRRYLLSADEDFFKKETDEKYYVIGFFFADGSFISNGIKFDQSEGDIEILYKIKEAMSLETEVKIYEASNAYAVVNGETKTYLCQPMARLSISRTEFRNYLLNFGFTLDKTYDESSFEIPLEFIPSFIRGFLDGDGSISVKENKTVSFTIKNKENAYRIQDLLNNIGIPSSLIYSQTKDVFSVRITKISDLIKLRDMMYSDSSSNLYLQRKKDIFYTL